VVTQALLGARFRTLWLAASISYIGDGVALVAFPLLAVQLTSSPILVAGTQVARGLPFLLFGVIAGVIADRSDRRQVMVGVDTTRALAVALLAVLVAVDAAPIGLVFVVVFVLASGETLFDPAAAALLPNVVAMPQLERANGRLIASESTAKELVGPALGGVLFAIATWTPFALDAMSFAGAAVLVVSLPGSFRAQRFVEHDGRAPTLRSELATGWNFLRANGVLRSLAVFGTAVNFTAAAVEATIVLFALQVLHTGNVGFGLLLATAAVGGVLAAITTDRVTARFGAGTVLVGGYVAAGVATLVAALTSNAYLCGVALAAVFACHAWADVVSSSLRQELTPDPLRGRVYSLFRTAMWGVWPIGAVVGGVLATWSLRAPLLLFALVSIGVGIVAGPLVGNRAITEARAARRSEPDTEPDEIDMHPDPDEPLAPLSPVMFGGPVAELLGLGGPGPSAASANVGDVETSAT
jgi:MFS family permease